MTTQNKIIHIIINDWNTQLKDSNCSQLLSDLSSIDKNNKNFPFNYTMCNIDYAMFYLITTTEEDIKKNNLDELLDYVADEDSLIEYSGEFAINMFPSYNPELWNSPDNGKCFDLISFDQKLYIVIDDNGDEYMMNIEPRRIDEYINTVLSYQTDKDEIERLKRKYEAYKKHSYNECVGWFHQEVGNKPEDDEFILFNYIKLPTGFIKQYIGEEPDNHKVYEFKFHDPLKVKLFD